VPRDELLWINQGFPVHHNNRCGRLGNELRPESIGLLPRLSQPLSLREGDKGIEEYPSVGVHETRRQSMAVTRSLAKSQV
jgi:hypothetical protein